MDLTTYKWILLGVMFSTGSIFGLLPIKLLKIIESESNPLHNRAALIVSLLSCFSGGVFLSVCFLDMFPDSLEAWANVQKEKSMNCEFPVVEAICVGSFFLVYLIEELSSMCCQTEHEHTFDIEMMPKRARFATVGSIFAMDGTVLPQRKESIESLENHGGEGSILKSIVFVSAFVFHVFLETFAFGVQSTAVSTTSLFIGIIVHKGIVSFSIGMKLTRNHPKRWWLVVIFVVGLASFNLIGGTVGILISSSNMDVVTKDMCTTIMMSFSLGIFIYVSMFEMLAPERANSHSNILQWLASVFGFVLFSGVVYLT